MFLQKTASNLLKLLLKPLLELFQSLEAIQLKPIKVALCLFHADQNKQKKFYGVDFSNFYVPSQKCAK